MVVEEEFALKDVLLGHIADTVKDIKVLFSLIYHFIDKVKQTSKKTILKFVLFNQRGKL